MNIFHHVPKLWRGWSYVAPKILAYIERCQTTEVGMRDDNLSHNTRCITNYAMNKQKLRKKINLQPEKREEEEDKTPTKTEFWLVQIR